MQSSFRALVLTAVLAGGCAATSSPAPTAIAIRTQPSAAGTCLQAKGGGILVADPVSGLGLRAPSGGHVLDVYWPYGWTARPDGSAIALLDADGKVVAHVGDQLSMAGGLGNGNDWIVCQVQPVIVVSTPSPSATVR